MKKINSKNNLGILLASFLSIILIFSVMLTMAAAVMLTEQNISGQIRFGETINFNHIGITKTENGDMLLQYKDGEVLKDFVISDVKPNDSFELVNPAIEIKEGSASSHVRAKLVLKDAEGVELTDETKNAVFSELPVFDSQWNEKNGWYYLSATAENNAELNLTDLSALKESVSLFKSTVVKIGSDYRVHDFITTSKEVNLTLRLEYVEATEAGYEVWGMNSVANESMDKKNIVNVSEVDKESGEQNTADTNKEIAPNESLIRPLPLIEPER